MIRQDSITESEILEVLQHPNFKEYYLDIFMAAVEDAAAYSDKMLKFIPYIKEELVIADLMKDNNALKGKEKVAFEWAEKIIQPSNNKTVSDFYTIFSMQSDAIPAFLITMPSTYL